MRKKNYKIIINDSTLRDGNHAISHQIDKKLISKFIKKSNSANLKVIEVGHGNGLGASSLSIGRSKISNKNAIKIAKSYSHNIKISTHCIPGFSNFHDIEEAKNAGLDIIRIGANATEIDTCIPHIKFSQKIKLEVWCVFMMSHLLDSNKKWAEKIKQIREAGIKKIIVMDSAGYFMPDQIERLFYFLCNQFENIEFGFHGHNNFGCALWNSIVAVKNGAKIIDSSIKGFGAGAGNTQTEVLASVLSDLGYETGIDLNSIFQLSDSFESMISNSIKYQLPRIDATNILSAKYGLFSGFAPKVKFLSNKLKIDIFKSFKAIGDKKLVAGQEDLILNILTNIKNK